MTNRELSDPLHIAVLWTELSGYLGACLRVLAERHQVELLVSRIARDSSEPTFHAYDSSLFGWLPRLYTLPDDSKTHSRLVLERLSEFRPQAVIVSGWGNPVYRQVARWLKQHRVLVVGTCDNPWSGTFRQRMGVLIAPWFLQSIFDVLWVPGERGATFGSKLGFTGNRLLRGLYTCDRTIFAPIAEWRLSQAENEEGWPRRFLFSGQFVERKGVPELLAAYQRYRCRVKEPWELWCAGSGPLESHIGRASGVKLLGFVQPRDHAQAMKQVGVFVLPSHFDPWPLVIHEATSAGLPILCSRQCGSSVELIQDSYNGFLFEAGDVNGLADLMEYISSGVVSLAEFGRRSAAMSARYSPTHWADHLISFLERFRMVADQAPG